MNSDGPDVYLYTTVLYCYIPTYYVTTSMDRMNERPYKLLG